MDVFNLTATLSLDTSKYNSAISSAQQKAQKFSTGAKSIGTGMMKAGGVMTLAGAGMVASMKKLIDATEVQQSAENKLVEIYDKRMGANKEAAKSTMDLASALQKQGVIGDEVTLSGAQQLATYAKMPNTVNKLLPAMDNLLVQQKGYNASAGDAQQVANLFGKAMMGQTGALKRVGISFDDSQAKILKYGTEEEKAAVLSEVVTQNVGEMNKKFAETDMGKMQQAKNSLGDLAEKAGATLLPVIADIAKWLSENLMPKIEGLINFLESHPTLAKIAVAITGILTVGGPLLALIGSFVTGIGGLVGGVGKLSGALKFLAGNPVILIIAGIVALVLTIMHLWKTNEKFRNAIIAIWNAIKTVASTIWNAIKLSIITPIKTAIAVAIAVYNGFKAAFMAIGEAIKTAVTAVWGFISKIIQFYINLAVTVATAIYQGLKKAFIAIGGAIKKAVTVVWKAISTVVQAYIKTAVTIAKTVYSGLKATFKTIGNAIKKVVSAVWNAIKTVIVNPIKKAKSVVSSTVNGIKSTVKSVFDSLKSSVSKVWNGIKDAITGPIKKAKGIVKGVVDAIKNFFPVKVGKIFSGWVPKISLWTSKKKDKAETHSSVKSTQFAKAMNQPYMFSKSTVFAAGDAGDEILYGRQSLMKDISMAVQGNKNDNNERHGTIVINLNYTQNDDATDMLRDIAKGVRRYRMAGAI